MIGLGYAGLALAARFRREGWEVVGTTTTPRKCRALNDAGVKAWVFPSSRAAAGGIDPQDEQSREPGEFDGTDEGGSDVSTSEMLEYLSSSWAVVSCAPPERGTGRDVAFEALGARALATPLVVYVSSTGVYGDRGGATVTESSSRRPKSAPGLARARAEMRWEWGAEVAALEPVWWRGGRGEEPSVEMKRDMRYGRMPRGRKGGGGGGPGWLRRVVQNVVAWARGEDASSASRPSDETREKAEKIVAPKGAGPSETSAFGGAGAGGGEADVEPRARPVPSGSASGSMLTRAPPTAAERTPRAETTTRGRDAEPKAPDGPGAASSRPPLPLATPEPPSHPSGRAEFVSLLRERISERGGGRIIDLDAETVEVVADDRDEATPGSERASSSANASGPTGAPSFASGRDDSPFPNADSLAPLPAHVPSLDGAFTSLTDDPASPAADTSPTATSAAPDSFAPARLQPWPRPRLAILRAGGIYGPRRSALEAAEAAAHAAEAGRPLPPDARGAGGRNVARIHVADLAEAVWRLVVGVWGPEKATIARPRSDDKGDGSPPLANKAGSIASRLRAAAPPSRLGPEPDPSPFSPFAVPPRPVAWICNLVDADPAPRHQVLELAARLLHLVWRPDPSDDAKGPYTGERRKVDGTRLTETLLPSLKYPSYREGLEAIAKGSRDPFGKLYKFVPKRKVKGT